MHSNSTISPLSNNSNDTCEIGSFFSKNQLIEMTENFGFIINQAIRKLNSDNNILFSAIDERLDTIEQSMNALKRQKEKAAIIPIVIEGAAPALQTEKEIILFNKVEFETYMTKKFHSDLLNFTKTKNDKNKFDWVFKLR
jgi:hypothetical protein